MGIAKQTLLEQMEEESRPVPGHFCEICEEPLTQEEVSYCDGLCSYHHYALERINEND